MRLSRMLPASGESRLEKARHHAIGLAHELVPDRWGQPVRASELGYQAMVIAQKRQCDRKTIRRIERGEPRGIRP